MPRPRKPAVPEIEEIDDEDKAPAANVEPADPFEHWPTITQCEMDTGIPASTLRRWCKEGKLKSVLRFGSYKIDPVAVLELSQKEERLSAVQAPLALAQGEGSASGSASTATQIASAIPTGLLNAASEVIAHTKAHANQADQHAEEAIRLLLATVRLQQQGAGEVLSTLILQNKALATENAELRKDLKDYFETQKTDKIREKELQIKADTTKEALSIGKLLAPQVAAFILGKANPTNPDATDKGIAEVLGSLSQEQALELHSKKLITDAQAQEALSFRVNGAAARGAMTRWMQSFSSQQIGNIVASSILKKEQSIALTAAHEAASKIKLDQVEAPPAAAAAPAASSSSTTTAAAAPAASSSSTTTATTDRSNMRLFEAEEVEAIAAMFAVLLENADVEVNNKGDKSSLLTFFVEKLGALAPRLKTIRWDRTP